MSLSRNGSSAGLVRLLVIDDDVPVQVLMKAIFHRTPVVVDCVGDGDAALERLRRETYDAIILDLMVPGSNGFEIVREIKCRDASLLGRTIVLTAASDVTLRDFEDGKLLRRIVRKPFDLDELVAEVLALRPDDARGPAVGPESH